MIKAFMFDLDGTLIDDTYTMSPLTIKALKRLKEKGYTMVCSSGRPFFLSDYVTDPTLGPKFFDYVYGNNGSELYNNITDEFKFLHKLTAQQIKDIVKLYGDKMFTLGTYEKFEDGYYVLFNKEVDNDDVRNWLKARGLRYKVIDYDKDAKDYSKVICLHEKDNYDKSVEYIATHQTDFTTIVHSTKFAIEINPLGVSKASAVKDFCKLTNIKPDEVIAFGDSENDVPMLLECNGVLMGNARDAFKEKVKTHTLSVKEDGVYHYLEKNGYLD